jgi:hypothetical protein
VQYRIESLGRHGGGFHPQAVPSAFVPRTAVFGSLGDPVLAPSPVRARYTVGDIQQGGLDGARTK